MEEVDLLRMKFRRLLQSSSQCAEFACEFRIAWRIAHVEDVNCIMYGKLPTSCVLPRLSHLQTRMEVGGRRWEMNNIKSRSKKEKKAFKHS